MATSSITYNFILTDQDEIERFAKALEEAANDPVRPISRDFKCLKDPDELKEFMDRRRAMLAAKTSAEEKDSID